MGKIQKTHNFPPAFTNIIYSLLIFVLFGWIIIYRPSGGWQYMFEKDIPLLKSAPKIFHSLTLHDSSLYIGVTDGTIYSLNRLTGAVQWQHKAQEYSIYPAAFGNQNLVYFSDFDGYLYAVNQTSGEEVWKFGSADLFRNDTEPVVIGNLVLFGGRNGVLYALEQQTGEVRWTFQTMPIDRSNVSSKKTILHFGRFAVDNTTVYINSSTDNAIIALTLQTGKELWRFKQYGFVFQKPTVFPNSIGFWSDKGSYYLLDKVTGKLLYSAQTAYASLYEGRQHIYRIHDDQSIEGIDTTTGSTLWIYKSKDAIPSLITERDNTHILVAGKHDNKTFITLIDILSGTPLWSKDAHAGQALLIGSNAGHIYSIAPDVQCSLDDNGTIEWCADTYQNVTSAFIASNGLFLIATGANRTDISSLSLDNGSRKWLYQSDNINTDIMKEYKGNLYGVTKDNKKVIMLDGNASYPQLTDSNLKVIKDTNTKPGIAVQIRSAIKQNFIKRSDIVIDTPETSPKANDLYEISIHLEDSFYINPHEDADIVGVFTDEKGTRYQSRAFYYDNNIWKIRFVPNVTGLWKWDITIHNSVSSHTHNGSFIAEPSNNPGFLSINHKDPRLFSVGKRTVFIPVGIQICIEDYNHDGNVLDQFPLTTAISPATNTESYPATSMEEYLSTFSDSGFSLFRWGAGNCSFALWKTLSSGGNRYALSQGRQLDTFFASLRHHGFHVWMSLFSFSMPFEKTLPLQEKKTILKKYLRYVVSRYASYVDVWELTNEIHLDDSLLTFMSDYIRSIDPYHHPITTNWERPDLPSIDITSLHWYGPTCNQFCDEGIVQKIKPYESVQKPIVLSEQGNESANWDEFSAARMRIRLWVAFFEKAYLIFWGTPNTLFVNKKGASNIYIGPVEREYVFAFHSFFSDHYDTYIKYPIWTNTDGDNVYAVTTGQQIMGYVYRQITDTSPKTTSFRISLPDSGVIQWIDPATGSILMTGSTKAGSHILNAPDFSTDVAFKIFLSEK